MPSFQERFEVTKGEPITYKGNTLVMSDEFPIDVTPKLRLIFEECNGEWRQGVALDTLDKGKFLVIGQQFKKVVFWQDTAPPSIEFEVVGGSEPIVVHNVWDWGDGVIESWHHGAAMIVEELENGRRYRCNDGKPDDDFDDIVFRIERV